MPAGSWPAVKFNAELRCISLSCTSCLRMSMGACSCCWRRLTLGGVDERAKGRILKQGSVGLYRGYQLILFPTFQTILERYVQYRVTWGERAKRDSWRRGPSACRLAIIFLYLAFLTDPSSRNLS